MGKAGFYRAVAAEYDDHALPMPGGSELSEALNAFRPTGSVLELACGPGTWTGRLLRACHRRDGRGRLRRDARHRHGPVGQAAGPICVG